MSQSRQYTSESRRALVNEMLEEKRRLAAVMYQGRSYAEQEKYEKAEEVRRRYVLAWNASEGLKDCINDRIWDNLCLALLLSTLKPYLTTEILLILPHRRRAMQEERERQRQEQQRLTREQYLYKMEQEALRKRQAEDVILQLESEERELINRLRKTQELQEKVFGRSARVVVSVLLDSPLCEYALHSGDAAATDCTAIVASVSALRYHCTAHCYSLHRIVRHVASLLPSL